jgi:hypothetical protein
MLKRQITNEAVMRFNYFVRQGRQGQLKNNTPNFNNDILSPNIYINNNGKLT